MAKVSLVILPTRPNSDGEHTVYLQISAHNKTIRSATEVTVRKEHWLKKEETIRSGREGDPLAANKNVRLTQLKNQCEVKILRDPEMVARMEVTALKKFLLGEEKPADTNFINFLMRREQHFRSTGRVKSADLLSTTATKLRDFWGGSDLDFSDIDVQFLEKFEAYCLRTPKKVHGRKLRTPLVKKMTLNGVAVYMRYIRTAINAGIDEGLTERYPFKKYRIKTEPTRNRNLSVEEIRRIRDFESEDPMQRITRDVFLLQFMLQGINLVDLFWMRHENVVGGRLQYYRRKTMSKTPRWCNTLIEPEAQKILSAYRGEKYLLWFADYSAPERVGAFHTAHARRDRLQWKDHSAFIKTINVHLAEIQQQLQINPTSRITGYFVRHSFASILREIGIPIDDISLSMAHRPASQRVTGIYINEDFLNADIANRKLIDYLNRDITPAKRTKKANPPANP